MLKLEFRDVTSSPQGWLVREFASLYRQEHEMLIEKLIPRLDVGIVFQFKDMPASLGETPIRFKPISLTPIIGKYLTFEFGANVDSFMVGCKPTVLSRIFHLNLSQFDHSTDILPYELFYPLWEKLSLLKTLEGRTNCFIKFMDSIQKNVYKPDNVDILYDRILEKGVHTPLKDIIESCCASERTLQRNFIKRAGVSAKTLTKIVRLNYLWGKVNNEKAVDYQDLVFYGNYFDQTHFIKDFKSMTGETPHFFFHRNLETVKALAGRL